MPRGSRVVRSLTPQHSTAFYLDPRQSSRGDTRSAPNAQERIPPAVRTRSLRSAFGLMLQCTKSMLKRIASAHCRKTWRACSRFVLDVKPAAGGPYGVESRHRLRNFACRHYPRNRKSRSRCEKGLRIEIAVARRYSLLTHSRQNRVFHFTNYIRLFSEPLPDAAQHCGGEAFSGGFRDRCAATPLCSQRAEVVREETVVRLLHPHRLPERLRAAIRLGISTCLTGGGKQLPELLNHRSHPRKPAEKGANNEWATFGIKDSHDRASGDKDPSQRLRAIARLTTNSPARAHNPAHPAL